MRKEFGPKVNVEDRPPDYFDRLAKKHKTTRAEEIRRASQVSTLHVTGLVRHEAHAPAKPTAPLTLRDLNLTPRQARVAPLVGAFIAGQPLDPVQDPSDSSTPTAPPEDTSPPQS